MPRLTVKAVSEYAEQCGYTFGKSNKYYALNGSTHYPYTKGGSFVLSNLDDVMDCIKGGYLLKGESCELPNDSADSVPAMDASSETFLFLNTSDDIRQIKLTLSGYDTYTETAVYPDGLFEKHFEDRFSPLDDVAISEAWEISLSDFRQTYQPKHERAVRHLGINIEHDDLPGGLYGIMSLDDDFLIDDTTFRVDNIASAWIGQSGIIPSLETPPTTGSWKRELDLYEVRIGIDATGSYRSVYYLCDDPAWMDAIALYLYRHDDYDLSYRKDYYFGIKIDHPTAIVVPPMPPGVKEYLQRLIFQQSVCC